MQFHLENRNLRSDQMHVYTEQYYYGDLSNNRTTLYVCTHQFSRSSPESMSMDFNCQSLLGRIAKTQILQDTNARTHVRPRLYAVWAQLVRGMQCNKHWMYIKHHGPALNSEHCRPEKEKVRRGSMRHKKTPAVTRYTLHQNIGQFRRWLWRSR